MDINAKIKLLADTMTGYSVIVDSSNGANVELPKVAMPCILVFIQDTGEFKTDNSHYRDSINIKIAFLNKMPKGFKESDVESMRYDLKQDMILLYHKLKFDFQFKINNEALKYEIVYDEFDDNLIGVVFNDNIKERVGLNLACETPDSIVVAPTSVSFCQKVSECSSIISINQLINGLQEQIDNLPTDGGLSGLTTNKVLKATSSTTVGDSSINDSATNGYPVVDIMNSGVSVNFYNGVVSSNVNIDDGSASLSFYDGTNSQLINCNILDNTISHSVKNRFNAPVHEFNNSVTKDGHELATESFVDNRVQSNIKVIGDWDATSGSYPLNDESNTTPFITQWGATIKQGWAFRVSYGQAGTVDGFDYENGDVVYALVDSPTDNSSDWGDLDHNLQQANESLRGTAKIVTSAIIADETSTDDERVITTKKLWLNFWNRVLAIAHTFAAKITFSTAPRFSSGTSDTVPYLDSNKDLVSSSVTSMQLSFLDATSSIQTQLNDREVCLHRDSSDSAIITGVTTEQIVSSFTLLGGVISPNYSLINEVYINKTGSAGALTVRVRYGNSATIAGSTVIATFTSAIGMTSAGFTRRHRCKSATITEQFNVTTSALADIVATTTTSVSQLNIDHTQPRVYFLTIQLANIADSGWVSDWKSFRR